MSSSFVKPSRRADIAPFLAMDVMREARVLEASGKRIIHMELGEPGAPAPERVRRAAAAALDQGALGYSEARGDARLRKRIAAHYAETYDVDLSPDDVIVTTGSSGAFMLAFLAGFDAGARIAMAVPGYPAYANILDSLGLRAAPIEVGPQDRFTLTAARLEEAHRREKLDGVLLMSPANPTGTMLPADELRRICEFCDSAGVLPISDEIYHGLEYEAPAETARRFSRNAIVVNSFSKYYAMTGWRLGWLVAPRPLLRPLERLQQSLAICPPTLSQIAALKAFDARDQLETIKSGYTRSRALLMDLLPRIGLPRFAPPDGAFYIYADIGHLTDDSTLFCKRLLEEAGVATTPGVDFDRARGKTALRLSYAGPERDVALGLERLAIWLSDQHKA
jgi:aspartate/methionine/tyrosine aminotransferase